MQNPRLIRSILIATAVLLLLAQTGCFLPSGSPDVFFVVSTSEGESPLTITFDASGSSDPDGAVVLYEWDFGDGVPGTGRTTVHVYLVDTETVFTVRLTVTDDDGNQSSATKRITVRPAPPPPQTTRVEFVWPFHYDAQGDDAANLNDEYFALQNTGSQPIDLTGWTVSNERGAAYRFPNGFTLDLGAIVYIHSGAGTDTSTILYWHASGPVWNDQSDIAVLRGADGVIVSLYAYNDC